MNKNLNKILVIRFSSIGDIILTTPVLEAIKKKYPNALIDFLVLEEFEEVISQNPFLSEIILFNKTKYDGIWGIKKFVNEKLKSKKYDLVIDLHSKIRSKLIIKNLKIKFIRYYKRKLYKSLFVKLKFIRYKVDDTIKNNYFRSLEKIDVFDNGEKFRIDFDFENIKKYKKYKDCIVLAPGASKNTKKWPVEYYVKLANFFTNQTNLFVGKKSEKEEILKLNLEKNSEVLMGDLSLKELFAVISLSKIVICNDSATFHIARALQKKVYVIFGPTDPDMFEFGEKDHLVISNLPCHPCSLHGDKKCKLNHFLCMKSLKPEKVYELIKKNDSLVI